jgi:hypothetical protein
MKLFIHQKNNLDNNIQINLLDNPAIRRWVDQCMLLENISGYIGNTFTGKRGQTDNRKIEKQYNLLLTTIVQLNQTQLPIKVFIPEIPNTFNFNMHWCNDIHNIFLDIMNYISENMSYHDRITNPTIINLESIATSINTIIHTLDANAHLTDSEIYCMNNYPHYYLQTFIDTPKYGLDLWFTPTIEEQKLYHSHNHSCNVVFGNSIVGKTYFSSFIQEEKRNSPAISGITGTWGNLEILLDNNRTKIYNSKKFKNWLDKELYEVPLEFPVGTVDSSCNLQEFTNSMSGSQFLYRFVI